MLPSVDLHQGLLACERIAYARLGDGVRMQMEIGLLQAVGGKTVA